jgi:hypothetical protein
VVEKGSARRWRMSKRATIAGGIITVVLGSAVWLVLTAALMGLHEDSKNAGAPMEQIADGEMTLRPRADLFV